MLDILERMMLQSLLKGDDFKVKLSEPRKIKKVIIQDKAVVVIDTYGNKYIAQPEKGEKFDEEKGLYVALAKYCGFTTTKVQALLESAVRKNANKDKKDTKAKSKK